MRMIPLSIQGNIVEANRVYTTFDPFSGEKSAEVCFAEPIHIVQALQGLKKHHGDWQKLNLKERATVFQNWAEMLSARANEWALSLAQDQGLPEDFVVAEEITPIIRLLQKTASEMQSVNLSTDLFHLPSSGPIAIVTAWTLSFRLAMERLVPALASGHSVILSLSPIVPAAFEVLNHLLAANEAAARSVQVLSCSEDAIPILLNHPGIRSVSFVGSEKTFAKFIEPQSWLSKKMQLSFGTKNSAVILPGFERSQMREMLRSFLIGQGQLCWNATRLFVLESMQADIHQWLKEEIESLKPSKSALGAGLLTPLIDQTRRKQFMAAKSQIAKEGKFIVGGEEKGNCVLPIFTKDLPNCSELQQDDLGLPVFFVTAVKYQYEVAKWANNTSYSQLTTIWGDEEKSRKVAQQLDSALIQYNHWTTDIPPGTGGKNTVRGNQDFSWTGSFYSDLQKFSSSKK